MKIGIDMDDTICSTEESIIRYQNIFVKENNINAFIWNKKTLLYKQNDRNRYKWKIEQIKY